MSVFARRRFLLSCLAGSGIAASYPCYFEPRWLAVTGPRVKLGRASLAEPLRLLHLSDLHLSSPVPLSLIESAVTLGLDERPDLICVTGDFITHREDLAGGAYARTLSRLSATAPTFAVLGNHDGGRWAAGRGGYSDSGAVRQLLKRSGIQLLHNTSARLRVGQAEFALVGVGDLWSDEIDSGQAFQAADPRQPTILLAHNPDSKDLLAGHAWDLMLSGHTHGGQVRIPWEGPIFAPVADMRYVAGLGAWGSRQIHVSCGVGNLGGVRFLCRPEVNLLILQ